MEPITTTVLFTAGVLGVTHGIEPDHAAGIASLTSDTGEAKRSALVGGCFAAGHVLLILVWIGVAYLFFGATSVPEATEAVGTIVLGMVLVLLGGVLGVTGARTFIHTHGHSHASDEGDQRHHHRHLHLHSPLSGDHGETSHDHDASETATHTHEHTVRSYLEVGVVGALFTLSPPLSMLAFVSIVVRNTGIEGAILAVAIYAITIVTTMASIGGGVGFVFGAASERSERAHASLQVGSAAIVFALGCYFLAQALSSVAIP
jgi:ABC-type nickel/cobalt efflux system permease component RcnA